MIARFRIVTSMPPTPSLVNRLRNFGEGVASSLAGKARVDMKEVDAATEFFWVEVVEKRHLGDVGVTLKKLLAHSAPDGAFTIERIRG